MFRKPGAFLKYHQQNIEGIILDQTYRQTIF